MKNALIKDFFREIKKSRRKFLSLFALSALAVAFLSGLRVTKPDMWHSADVYYKSNNFMDIFIMSTLGLTDDDVEEFSQVDGVKDVEGSKSMDALIDGVVVTVLSAPENINKLRLKEGRLPEKSNECVTEKALLDTIGLNIGDKITLDLAGQDENIDNLEYTIVGIADNPLYVSLIRGSSSIGNGSVSAWVCIPKENFTTDYYSRLFVTLDGTSNLNAYEQPYDDYMEEMCDKLEPIADDRLKVRYDEVVTEAREELADGYDEYYEEKEKAEKELADAKKELDDANAEIVENTDKLKDALEELTENQQKLDDAKDEIDKGSQELSEAKESLDNLKTLIDSITSAAENGGSEADGASSFDTSELHKYEADLAEIGVSVSEIENLNASNYMSVMGKLRRAYFEGLSQYQEGLSTLQNARTQYIDGTIEINKAWEEFEEGLTELEDGQKEFEDGVKEYEDGKAEAEEKLEDALKELQDAEKDIEDLGDGDIYVLDRNSNIGYVGFGQDSDRMGNLAQVFPVIFFLVAALSCLTTVTRMIEEGRTEIGTLKALGYSRRAISIKYIGYAASASFLGGIFGAIVGCIGIPFFIYNAWLIMYFLPPLSYLLQLDVIIPAIMTSVIALSVTAVFACMSTLIDTPASLMRPKAPKPGKRILLERITFIWKKMKFSHKVAARNLFRFKQRFWMTVIGIAGCSGLLVTGIGLHDSIFDILNKQFDELTIYDISISLDSDLTDDEVLKIDNKLKEQNGVLSTLSIYEGNVDAYSDEGIVEGVTLIPIEKEEEFKDYFVLRHRLDDMDVNFTEDGALINEKMATLLDVEAGDDIEIMLDDDRKVKIHISDIIENYVSHYIYMTDKYYEKVTGNKISKNVILAKLSEDADTDSISSAILDMDNVSSFSKIVEMRERFENSFNSVDYAVMIIVFSAAALAFIVLYNLMNINITERTRELATLKVLGFTDSETAAYTFRENMIMTFIGIFFGMFFGMYLHSWLIGTIEISQVMFGRSVHEMSFIYSAILTIVFALMVNYFAFFVIKKINMVESLKSAE